MRNTSKRRTKKRRERKVGLLLKVLETEEVYVDINVVTRINLTSLLS